MWSSLNNLDRLEQSFQESTERTQVYFKHSTRCSISRVALSRFEREPLTNESTDFLLLDLLQHRSLSQQLTERLRITHESPQVLIVKNGVCIYHANHLDIEPAEVDAALSALGN